MPMGDQWFVVPLRLCVRPLPKRPWNSCLVNRGSYFLSTLVTGDDGWCSKQGFSKRIGGWNTSLGMSPISLRPKNIVENVDHCISETMGQGKNDLAVLHLTFRLDSLEFSLLCLSILHPLAFRLKTWTTKMESFGILLFWVQQHPCLKKKTCVFGKLWTSWKSFIVGKPEALLNFPRSSTVLPPPIPKLKIEVKGRVPTGRIERHSFLVCFDGFLPLAIRGPECVKKEGFNHFNRW